HRDLWLRPIECVGIGEGRIHLRAPNRYHKEWFEDNFLPSILKDLETRTHRPFTVDFEVTEGEPASAVKSTGVRNGAGPRPAGPLERTPPPSPPPPGLMDR